MRRGKKQVKGQKLFECPIEGCAHESKRLDTLHRHLLSQHTKYEIAKYLHSRALRVSSSRRRGQTVIEGFDEENRTYSTVLKRSEDKFSKGLRNACLEDVPQEIRRKEAGKALYITRYE